MNHLKVAVPLAAACFLGACGNDNSSSSPSGNGIAVPASVQAAQSGYKISVFAQAPGTLRPDDLLQMGSTVFAVLQDNNNNPDGTNAPGTTPQSKVIEYDLSGNVLQTFNVPGHPDGLLAYNANTVWVSTNEDANPELIIINTSTNAAQVLTSDAATLPHGGGLDDLKLVNGTVYASASNPGTGAPAAGQTYSTDGSGATAEFGVSTSPAVYAVTLNSDGKTFHVSPALTSGSAATLLPGSTAVTLNMTDPDSSAVDPAGDLVIDSQQDSELVFVSKIGSSGQAVTVLPLTLYGNPWPVDDTRWSPASGSSFMLLSDNKAQLIYRIDAAAGFTPSTAYSAGQGTLLQTNISTGAMTPVYVGMNTPHGLIFVSN